MAEENKPTKSKVKTTKVVAVRDRFVDLESNREITKVPVEVEMTGWLQAQVDAGLLQIV